MKDLTCELGGIIPHALWKMFQMVSKDKNKEPSFMTANGVTIVMFPDGDE